MSTASFTKPAHRRIARLLATIDADFFSSCECYFGGGTAIVMLLDEYRESRDIDFLCASQEGYRHLRERVFHDGFSSLFTRPPRIVRDARADQYGIRAVLALDDAPIAFEIVREARMRLSGRRHPVLKAPTLVRQDLYAEKLLANVDRGGDGATRSRDFIDLVAMETRWGRTPASATRKAAAAYGQRTLDAALRHSEVMLADEKYRARCVADLALDPWLAQAIASRAMASAPKTSRPIRPR